MTTTRQSTEDKHLQVADELIQALGGRSNIAMLTCCVTRLRVRVADPNRIDHRAVRDHPAVLGRLVHGEVLHLIVGPSAAAPLSTACHVTLTRTAVASPAPLPTGETAP